MSKSYFATLPVKPATVEPPRIHSLETLIECLFEEIEIGTSETRLWASLLASTLALADKSGFYDYWQPIGRFKLARLKRELDELSPLDIDKSMRVKRWAQRAA